MLIDWLNLLAFLVYAYFTYLIAKDTREPLVSFSLHRIEGEFGHIQFKMINKSKVEVEVWSKVWIEVEDDYFSDWGFYGDKSPWVLQPFTEGQGHFQLKNFTNNKNLKLDKLIKDKKLSSVNIKIQIKYRALGKKKWKKSSVHKYVSNLENGNFWLDV